MKAKIGPFQQRRGQRSTAPPHGGIGKRPSPSLREAEADDAIHSFVLLWIASRSLSSGRIRATVGSQLTTKEKGAWFPITAFPAYGGTTLTGDFRTSAQGSAPSRILIGCRCTSGSRELQPETVPRWFPISVR